MARFHNMTEQGQERVVREGESDLSEYVNRVLFEDNGQRVEEILEQFDSLDEYQLVENEVDVWAGLVADRFIENVSEDQRSLYEGSRLSIVSAIGRYVLEQVDTVARSTPSHLRKMTDTLFLRLYDILDTRDDPDPNAQRLMSIFNFIAQRTPNGGREEPEEERESRRHLKEEYGKTVKLLQKECERTADRIREASRTENIAFQAYLEKYDADVEKYRALMQKGNAVQLVSDLAGAVTVGQRFFPDENRERVRSELGSFVKNLITSQDKYHERIFNQRIAEMSEIVRNAAPNETSPSRLYELLGEYLNDAPRRFAYDELLIQDSVAEKFEHPGFLRLILTWDYPEDEATGEYLGPTSAVDPDLPEDDKVRKYSKELAYVQGIRMCVENGNSLGAVDRSYEPLADMLIAQKNAADVGELAPLAWDFCEYVGAYNGNPECLGGIESDPIELKRSFLSTLTYNAKHNLRDQNQFENALRKGLSEAGDVGQKYEVLKKAKATLDEIRTMEEVLT